MVLTASAMGYPMTQLVIWRLGRGGSVVVKAASAAQWIQTCP